MRVAYKSRLQMCCKQFIFCSSSKKLHQNNKEPFEEEHLISRMMKIAALLLVVLVEFCWANVLLGTLHFII
jgi:hypothetical protein